MLRTCSAARAALLACCALLALSACAAAPWTPASFPNPATDVTLCNRRGVRSRICDPDGILSYEGANVLEATLADVADARAPFGMSACARAPGEAAGYEVAVALMAQMDVRDGLDVHDQAADFASALMTEWGVGNRRCNDGVLLLLSKDPREVYVYAGAGARERLTPDRILAAIDNMRPGLRAGDYDAALQRGAVDIGVVLAGGKIGGEGSGKWHSDLWIPGAFFSFVGALFGLSWWKERRRQAQVRTVQALVDKLKREQAVAAATHAYPAASCPVCFEDFNDAPSAPPLPRAGLPGEAGGAAAERADGAEGAGPSGGGRGAAAPDKGKADAAGDAELRTPLLPPLRPRQSGHEGAAAPRRRLVLPCGHTFCESCISTWVSANETCPICREPLVGQAAPAAAPRWSQGAYEQELVFRLMRLHTGYPGIVDGGMVERWSEDARQGRPIEWSAARWAAERAAQTDDAQLRADRAHAGSYGAASSSFGGGGGGGGGGGAGGGW